MEAITLTTCQAQCTEEIVSAVSAFLSRRLGIQTRLIEDIPWQARMGQIAEGGIDVGWICGSYYSKLAGKRDPVVELLAAPIMAQPRYRGQPVYFSDVIVKMDSPYERFDDLRGTTFAFNEPGSVSGYWTMRYYLARIGAVDGFFGRFAESGGHVNSIEMVLNGEADTAAIDSTVMAVELAEKAELAAKIRVVNVLGPTPVPPWVVRRSLPEGQKRLLRDALVGIREEKEGREMLDKLHVRGFTAVSDGHYDLVREMLRESAVVDW